MKLVEEIDLEKIRAGDNNPLTTIFSQCYQTSLRNIMAAMRCDKADAEDSLMDSIVALRDAIVSEQYRNENVGSYLTSVAINKLKNKNKKDYRIDFLEEEALILKSGTTNSEESATEIKVDRIIQSIHQLKDKCKNLLLRNLVDGASLNMLVSELGYNSYDVVKTSKARCMAKLRQIIQADPQNY